MKKKALKTTKKGRVAVIFPDWAVNSVAMFLHCARIPDVMVHIVKIREIHKRYKIPAPVYLFGLPVQKGFSFSTKSSLSASSLQHLNLMSFAVSLGLYDRFLRLRGRAPDILIGGSSALLVSAKVKSYEKTLVKMICEKATAPTSIRIYQKISEKDGDSVLGVDRARFSLLYFSKTIEKATWQNILKEQKIKTQVSVACSPKSLKPSKSKADFNVGPAEGLIETDPQLNWFWPILKKSQSKGLIVSPTFPSQEGFR